MKDKVLKIIQEKFDKSGHHGGVYLTKFGLNIKELKETLNELYREGKIEIREGIHGKMVKLKTTIT